MTICGVTRLDFLAYQALDAVNWSTLKYALGSGLAYRHCLDSDFPTETDPMRLGRATHTAVLEPDLFLSEYVVWEGGRRAGGEWEEFKAAHCTMTILRPEDAEAAYGIRDAVRTHPVAAGLLLTGEAECTVTWTDPTTGIACKGRTDWISDTALVDLKTTRSIDARAFGAQAAAMLYHGQLAFYQMGLAANGAELAVKIIAVESAEPYDVAVFELDEDVLWAGEVKVREALQTVKRCRAEKRWPGRYPKALPLQLPGYAFPSEEETDGVITGADYE